MSEHPRLIDEMTLPEIAEYLERRCQDTGVILACTEPGKDNLVIFSGSWASRYIHLAAIIRTWNETVVEAWHIKHTPMPLETLRSKEKEKEDKIGF